MWKTKLCMAANFNRFDTNELIKLYRKVGFDGFFTMYCNRITEYRETAEKCGMIFQSIHAPYHRTNVMWRTGEEADFARNELIKCVNDSADAGVPIIVTHAYIGMGDAKIDVPNEIGLSNYSAVVEQAVKRNVKIAFENTEGEEFLAALMNHFKGVPQVGFCWDTGHEMCYNHDQDMMSLYGDRLIATHINDNLGTRDFNGEITCHDDLHLLPFDGIGDWEDIAARLNKYGYNNELTFELCRDSKPNRHENDKYNDMTIERYVTEAYIRACRLASLKERLKNSK